MIKKFAHIENGKIDNTIIADDAFVLEHPLDWIECPEEFGIGDNYSNNNFFRDDVEVVPVILPWSKKDFLMKFTPQEYVAIKTVIQTNALLDYYWTLFTVADMVFKNDPVPIEGINALETAGILASGRADEILTG